MVLVFEKNYLNVYLYLYFFFLIHSINFVLRVHYFPGCMLGPGGIEVKALTFALKKLTVEFGGSLFLNIFHSFSFSDGGNSSLFFQFFKFIMLLSLCLSVLSVSLLRIYLFILKFGSLNNAFLSSYTTFQWFHWFTLFQLLIICLFFPNVFVLLDLTAV